MGIFHKLKVGFSRIFKSSSLEYTPEMKRFGNVAELGLSRYLKSRIPNCQIKSNVNIFLPKENAKAEIDCLVLIGDKLFAIEIKRWRGRVIEKEDGFHVYKQDKYTDDVWEKVLKSPFKQVGRAVSMLKKQTGNSDWIQTIVYFDGASSIKILGDEPWFSNADAMVAYMINYQNRYRSRGNIRCFNNAIALDYICSGKFSGLHCVIDDKSLQFELDGKFITRKDIDMIEIKHHFSFDDIYIYLCDGNTEKVKMENGEICVSEDGVSKKYSFCKIDKIILG